MSNSSGVVFCTFGCECVLFIVLGSLLEGKSLRDNREEVVHIHSSLNDRTNMIQLDHYTGGDEGLEGRIGDEG